MTAATLTDFLVARFANRDARVAGGDPVGWVYQIRLESVVMRRIVEECDGSDALGLAVRKLLALPYADHPEYDESWRPWPVLAPALISRILRNRLTCTGITASTSARSNSPLTTW